MAESVFPGLSLTFGFLYYLKKKHVESSCLIFVLLKGMKNSDFVPSPESCWLEDLLACVSRHSYALFPKGI